MLRARLRTPALRKLGWVTLAAFAVKGVITAALIGLAAFGLLG